ncbi:MAG TPA: hypothetical protein VFG86_13550 [Chloroflexota bacterium]|nr:hypothetical protein [Chloroflexota bacterium]
MSKLPDEAHGPDDALSVEPTQAEIERWAAEERERREAWLRGPTDAQKAAWAARERARRSGEHRGTQIRLPTPSQETLRSAQYAMREAQLAAEGAMSLLFRVSIRDVFDQLVRAGRDWENEYTDRPVRRRRIALDTEMSEPDPGSGEPPSSSLARSRGVSSPPN